MCNYCTVQKGIEQKEDIYKKIIEVNEINSEVMTTALEWKLFMEFTTVVLDEDLAFEGMEVVDKIFKEAHQATKEVNKVKTENRAEPLLAAITLLNDCKDTLEHSPVLKKITNCFRKSISQYLYMKVKNQ